MPDYFNDDFRDFIKSFNNAEVEYVLVGGMAVILHGYVRTTGDMDIWVKKTEQNYKRIVIAFKDFGMSVFDMTLQNFLSDRFDVWSFGRKPVLIELMTSLKGVDFDEAYAKAVYYTDENIPIRFLHLSTLLDAKRASGRYKDLDDIDQLSKG